METRIDPDDFDRFFEAVNGHPPFPWQSRLARQVIDHGGWPDVIDVPTGCGKTSALDIALFALAVDPTRHPRRIVMVVDRRVVVSQGARHARDLRRGLLKSDDPIAKQVTASLRELWEAAKEDEPFTVAEMRGGMPRDNGWARRPDQPMVGLSTVDQVGSRLLFRGYGLSPSMAPVHAGLVGNDALLLLDEVHLSIPFAETLQAIRDRWRKLRGPDLTDRWGLVRMSATPGAMGEADSVFSIDAADRGNAVIRQRLAASKQAELDEVKAGGKDEEANRRRFAESLAKHARGQVQQGCRAVAVVVNRVDTARRVRGLLDGDAAFDAALLTGRMRPLDRQSAADVLEPRVKAQRKADETARPLVLVATQCIEVGADFDFEGMVTECASLDALRQRFGRLDRLGERGTTRAVIAARADQVKPKADPDPVYGEALQRTWAWLQEQASNEDGTVDLGIDQLALPAPGELIELLAPHQHAPVLLPSHLDVWAQTNPRPWPDPEVALWLHGPDRGLPEVQLVWRCDLPAAVAESSGSESEIKAIADAAQTVLEACPPGGLEALSMPLYAARAWLAGRAAAEIADVVGATDTEYQPDHDESGRRCIAWTHEGARLIDPDEIKPGMTLVSPASYGGLRHGNWDPEATEAVADLGDETQWRLRGRAVLRLRRELVNAWHPQAEDLPLPQVPGDDDPGADPGAEIADWLKQAKEAGPDEPWSAIVARLRKVGLRRIPMPDGSWTLVGRRLRRGARWIDTTSEDDRASYQNREVTLQEHTELVRRTAEAFVRSLALSESTLKDIALAAEYHDLGKADIRFQRMLAGGSEVRQALQDQPMAKSAMPPNDTRARELARQRAGYPKGARHELLSVAMLASQDSVLAEAHDRDLVYHLIGCHHGWCRPFAPPVVDPNPVEASCEQNGITFRSRTDHHLARIDSGVADRFWTLVERYGWWGLAWLEAIFRLADHHASALHEQEAK